MKPKKVLLITGCLSLLALGGCATDEIARLEGQLEQTQQQLASTEQQNSTLVAQVQALEASMGEISTEAGHLKLRADEAEYALASRVSLPEGAKAGDCYDLGEDNALRSTLCASGVSPYLIKNIQTALDAAGFSPGKIDGIVGSKTLAALRAYQAAKSLSEGGLTIETIKSLGVL